MLCDTEEGKHRLEVRTTKYIHYIPTNDTSLHGTATVFSPPLQVSEAHSWKPRYFLDWESHEKTTSSTPAFPFPSVPLASWDAAVAETRMATIQSPDNRSHCQIRQHLSNYKLKASTSITFCPSLAETSSRPSGVNETSRGSLSTPLDHSSAERAAIPE